MENLVSKIRNFTAPVNLLQLMKNKETNKICFEYDSPIQKRKIIYELASIYETICSLERECSTWDQISIEIKDMICLPRRDTGLDLLKEDLTYCGQVKHYQKGGRICSKLINRPILCVNQIEKSLPELKLNIEFLTCSGVKLSQKQILGYEKIYHNIIDYFIAKKWILKALNFIPQEELSKDKIILRDCQTKALELMRENWGNSIYLQMATGSGKTIAIIQRIRECSDQKFVVLVPKIILLEQWSDELNKWNIEHSCCGTNHQENKESRVIVCVYNSFEKIMDFEWTYIIIDESHHIEKKGENEKYLDLIANKIKEIPAIHLTATMNENPNLYYDVRKAINDKVLVDYEIRIPIFSPGKYEEPLIKYLIERPKFTSILCFANDVKRAKEFNKKLQENYFNSEVLTCEEDKADRKIILDKFKQGLIQILVSVNILSEGIDLPITNTILFLDKKSSVYSISQCIGRALRLYPGKKIANIILPCVSGIEERFIYKFLVIISKYDSLLRKQIENRKVSHRINIDNEEDDEKNDEENEKESIYLYERLVKNSFDEYTDKNWNFKCEKLSEFFKKFGKFPSRTKIIDDIKIGRWLNKQRYHYRSKNLSKQRIDKLNQISNSWITDKISWDDKCDLFESFFLENESIPKEGEKFNGQNVDVWICKQRGKYREGGLSDEKIDRLNQISPLWIGNYKKVKSSEECFSLFKEFYDLNLRIPKEKEKYKNWMIGNWLGRQRKFFIKGSLSQKKIQLLDNINSLWKIDMTTQIWNKNCENLQKFYTENGRFPKRSEIFNDINIGRWLEKQRIKFRSENLPEENILKLEEIDSSWKQTRIFKY